MKLSAVIIARNAEDTIADAISSSSFVDEVVVIDGNSSDKTPQISKQHGAHVYSLDSDNFSEMRNYGIEKAKGEWILYVDSDEKITDVLRKNILSAVNKHNSFAAYRILRKNFYLGNYEWPHIEKLERLFKKENLKKWYGQLHESPLVDGKIGELEGYLLHFSHRDLSSMLSKTIEWSKVEADLRLKANHPHMTWWRFPRVMIQAFFNSYILQKGWKVGTAGIIESIYQAFSMFITYARLWEMQEKKKSS